MFLTAVLGVKRPVATAIPVIGFGGAILYRFVLVPVFPNSWPPMSPLLSFSVLLFCVTAAVFTLHTTMLMSYTSGKLHSLIELHAPQIVLGIVQAATALIAMLWLSAALA